MRTLLLSVILVFFVNPFIQAQAKRSFKIVTIAFYNLENLFDTEDDPLTFDNDRTPDGKDRWNIEKYQYKINNMAGVIASIGKDETGGPPAVIGVCEIENRKVLEDLLNTEALSTEAFGIIHFDSPDRRGIDVALLYRKHIFTPTYTSKVPLKLFDPDFPARRIYTRDQLVVSGILDGEPIHFIINHWPSRSGGELFSRPKRIKAAKLNKHIIDSLFSINPYAKIISMGDLNDDPLSPSVKRILNTMPHKDTTALMRLYNPMEKLYRKGLGTLAWRDGWNLFDQMIISSELLRTDYSSYRFHKAGIFNKAFLATAKGRYKGYPFRSFSNRRFTGGYSDHFPVYLLLVRELTD